MKERNNAKTQERKNARVQERQNAKAQERTNTTTQTLKSTKTNSWKKAITLKCKNPRTQECKNAKMQELRMQECENARLRQCKNARMQETQSWRTQECKKATMQHDACILGLLGSDILPHTPAQVTHGRQRSRPIGIIVADTWTPKRGYTHTRRVGALTPERTLHASHCTRQVATKGVDLWTSWGHHKGGGTPTP